MKRTMTVWSAVLVAGALLAGCEQESEPERPVTAPGGEMAPLDVDPTPEKDPAQADMDLYEPGTAAQEPAASVPTVQETEEREVIEITREPGAPAAAPGDQVAPAANQEAGDDDGAAAAP